MKKKILPPMYLLMSIVLMVSIRSILPVPRVIAAPWNLAGIAFLITGVIINIDADNTFRSMGTPVKPFKEATHLVTIGLFRISRNPMYFGFVLILIGLAIILASTAPFLIVILFAVLMDREFISVEEQMLARKYGREWDEYKRRVGRWI